MNDFAHSCNAAQTYPKNLISPGAYQHTLQNYVDHLDQHDRQLFDVEDEAVLDFWELDDALAGTGSQLESEVAPFINEDGRFPTHHHQVTRPGETHPLSTTGPTTRSNMPLCVSVGYFVARQPDSKSLQIYPRATLSREAAGDTKDVYDNGYLPTNYAVISRFCLLFWH